MNLNNPDLLSNDLEVTPTIQSNLMASAGWAKFLAIIGFITCFFMVIGAFGISQMSSYSTRGLPFNPAIFAILYFVLAVICFFPCLFLLRYSNKIPDAVKQSSQESLESAILNLKSMFRFMGIITIMIIVMYILLMVVVGMGMNRY